MLLGVLNNNNNRINIAKYIYFLKSNFGITNDAIISWIAYVYMYIFFKAYLCYFLITNLFDRY